MIIIEEYTSTGIPKADRNIAPIPYALVTSQAVAIGTLSAQFDSTTNFIRIQSKGEGFWWKIGGASVSAVAEEAGSAWLPADQFRDIALRSGVDLYIDTAAE